MSDADEKLLGQIDHITSIMEARGFPDTAAFVRRVGDRLAAVEAENKHLRGALRMERERCRDHGAAMSEGCSG